MYGASKTANNHGRALTISRPDDRSGLGLGSALYSHPERTPLPSRARAHAREAGVLLPHQVIARASCLTCRPSPGGGATRFDLAGNLVRALRASCSPQRCRPRPRRVSGAASGVRQGSRQPAARWASCQINGSSRDAQAGLTASKALGKAWLHCGRPCCGSGHANARAFAHPDCTRHHESVVVPPLCRGAGSYL